MKKPALNLLTPSNWQDYELLDSGNGLRLERFGPYVLQRPEHHAIWHQSKSKEEWYSANGAFIPGSGESGGRWVFQTLLPDSWNIRYKNLVFKLSPGNSKHLGFFPEQSVHWDWIEDLIQNSKRSIQVLNLFGYTGLASLVSARAGASVTHVDASKKAITWAKTNQALSKLKDKPIRWLVDDAVKFIQRENWRGSTYDGIILDPPKFGRGPKGQVWEIFKSLPDLLSLCRNILSDQPLFVVLTAYAIRAPALSLYYALTEIMGDYPGFVETGELALQESSKGRLLSTSIYARWRYDDMKDGK